jgi:mitogen-activated protein kinase kinase kinase
MPDTKKEKLTARHGLRLEQDLKADNVLVNLKGKCKISDFGISKRSNEAYLTSQYTPMQGTVFSMAPEMFNQPLTCRYSAKSDIWSLGCLVLEMLCGLRAWHGYGSLQIIYKVSVFSLNSFKEIASFYLTGFFFFFFF